VRQALFDMLMHAPWGGPVVLAGARVLDAFAGTGALGLEALSRGAGEAVFIERDAAALAALRANVVACGASAHAAIFARDVLRVGRCVGQPCSVAFFDPPYGDGLVQRAVNVLSSEGWLTPDCLLIAETGRLESVHETDRILAERVHGAARLVIWRA
jgi:16S rRNA (guanine966-N2)-methyltransferase